MVVILSLLLSALILGIALAIFVRSFRLIAVVVVSMLLYVPSYFVWFALQYFHIVPVDQLMIEMFGIYTYRLVGTWLGSLVMFGPPLLPSVILICLFPLLRNTNPVRKA